MKTNVIDVGSLDLILDAVTSDDKKERLLNVLYVNDSEIDKSALLNYIRDCVAPISTKEIAEYINLLDNNCDDYKFFLIKLTNKLFAQIQDGLGENYDPFYIASIERSVFWSLYVIAIKKCIGTENAAATLTINEYFHEIPNDLNKYQKNTHSDCLDIFNMNINKFTLKNTPDLRLFLHSFHSKNKSLRIRKKNLSRVKRRALKIVQVNKLANNGKSKSMFSNGQYLVPEQFAAAIVKLYLNK